MRTHLLHPPSLPLVTGLLLDVAFAELISVYWRFILSISTMDVVCTGNADNKSLVYIFGNKIKARIIC